MQFTNFLVSAVLASAVSATVLPIKGLPVPHLPAHGHLDPEVEANITATVFPRFTAGPTDGGNAAAIGKALYDAYTSVGTGIKADIAGRKAFTQAAALKVSTATGLNTVICNVGYDTTPDTINGLTFTKYTYDTSVGSDVSYDVLTFPNGMEFYRKGDGGYQNWAYRVDSRCKINDRSVDCRI